MTHRSGFQPPMKETWVEFPANIGILGVNQQMGVLSFSQGKRKEEGRVNKSGGWNKEEKKKFTKKPRTKAKVEFGVGIWHSS